MESKIKEKNVIYSRFTHRFDKSFGENKISAFYNSLRMLPVYMPGKSADIIDNYIRGGELPDGFKPVLAKLIKAGVIVAGSDFDDLVISKAREQLKEPAIKIAYFILTEKCNFDCSYCYVKNETPSGHKPRTMSKETAIAGVDTFARLADTSDDDRKLIILYGGEPLINFETVKEIVIRVAEYKKDKRLPENTDILIITNGSLINDEIASFFYEHGVQIAVSIDGDETATNSCRVYANRPSDVQSTFNSIMAGIETVKKHGCEVSLSVTLSEKSLENFASTLKLIDSIGCKEFGFNMMTVDGPREMALAETTTDAIIKAYEYFAPKGVSEDRIRRKVSAFNNAEIYHFDCAAAGANQITIAPEGAMGLCHVQVGSRTDFTADVNDVSFDPKNDKVFQEWNKRTPINMPQCQSCYALGICGGGCPYNARLKHGSIWDLDERFCVHAKMTLKYLIWDMFEKLSKKSDLLRRMY